MKEYLNTFKNYRWVIVLIPIVIMSYVFWIFMPEQKGAFIISNFTFWMLLDWSIGIGRSEKNIYKNIGGILMLIFVAILIFTQI